MKMVLLAASVIAGFCVHASASSWKPVATEFGVEDIPFLEAESDRDLESYSKKYVLTRHTFSATGTYSGFKHLKVDGEELWVMTMMASGQEIACIYHHDNQYLENLQVGSDVTVNGFVGIPFRFFFLINPDCDVSLRKI